jgi:hypothetical protein
MVARLLLSPPPSVPLVEVKRDLVATLGFLLLLMVVLCSRGQGLVVAAPGVLILLGHPQTQVVEVVALGVTLALAAVLIISAAVL